MCDCSDFEAPTVSPVNHPSRIPMSRPAPSSITLVGRAHDLAFANGIATWQIAVCRGKDREIYDFYLQASEARVLEQFEQMDEGQLIGVIAHQPAAAVPSPALTVTRLEILGKATPQQEVA